jgi:hypothetical protein
VFKDADTTAPSVGKLRVAADGAFAKGDIEEAARIWGKVSSFPSMIYFVVHLT